MDKAAVIANLAQVGYYVSVLTAEVAKEPFDSDKVAAGFISAQTTLLNAMKEVVADPTVISRRLRQLESGVSFAVTSLPAA
jgi:hypothetical protein